MKKTFVTLESGEKATKLRQTIRDSRRTLEAKEPYGVFTAPQVAFVQCGSATEFSGLGGTIYTAELVRPNTTNTALTVLASCYLQSVNLTTLAPDTVYMAERTGTKSGTPIFTTEDQLCCGPDISVSGNITAGGSMFTTDITVSGSILDGLGSLAAITPSAQQMSDASGTTSIDWNTRRLIDPSGNTICDWNSTGTLTFTDTRNIAFATSTTGTKIGTSASEKLGFWGVAPDVQPTTAITAATFVASSGAAAVNGNSTFGGYKIGQVVAALKRAGILA